MKTKTQTCSKEPTLFQLRDLEYSVSFYMDGHTLFTPLLFFKYKQYQTK